MLYRKKMWSGVVAKVSKEYPTERTRQDVNVTDLQENISQRGAANSEARLKTHMKVLRMTPVVVEVACISVRGSVNMMPKLKKDPTIKACKENENEWQIRCISSR